MLAHRIQKSRLSNDYHLIITSPNPKLWTCIKSNCGDKYVGKTMLFIEFCCFSPHTTVQSCTFNIIISEFMGCLFESSSNKCVVIHFVNNLTFLRLNANVIVGYKWGFLLFVKYFDCIYANKLFYCLQFSFHFIFIFDIVNNQILFALS